MFRKLSLALLLGVICATTALADGGQQQPSRTRECEFELNVPAILRVGQCIEVDGTASILVRTNSRTIVCVEKTNFQRNERDCEGRLLETIDEIPSRLAVRFVERPLCEEGARLEVEELPENCWCVNPHRGGYEIQFRLRAGSADICDDAGCYTATVTVTVTASPFEDCREVICEDLD